MSLESVFKLSLIMNMIDNLSGPMAGVASKVGANVSKLDAASQTFGSMAKAGAAMQETGSQIVNAVLAPVEATFETRRALGELASLGVQDLEAVENAARSFSDQWAGTSKADFISAAYDIKSGIASLSDEGVAEFTSLAALTAKATKSTAGEMTSLFATGYGIYKDYYSDLSDMEFGEMFSAGISDAVRAFKTSGSGMAQAIQNLGASATTAQVPLEEQLSVLGMLQATMGGAEAGTKYKAFLRSATKGGEALGLKFTDANNQLLSMPEILDILRGKFGETMDAAEKMELQKAFGDTEAVALIDLMYNKVGDLQDNIVNMYGSLGKGVSVTEQMASAIQETEPERFERLKQRIHNVTESIGNSLLPTVNDLMSKGEGVLTKVGSWIEKNQELVKVIMLIVLAVGGFLAVGGTLIALISGVGLVVTKTVSAFKIRKEDAMIYVEDELIKLNGVVLPGLVKSIEVIETAKVDEQEVEGSATKPKQATGYEDAKVNIELIIDDTPSQTKYQRYATLRAIFRSPGQSVPQPIPIISEDTAAHGVEKVIFKKLSHKGENKRGQLTATLELWEYIPQTITAKSGSSSGSSSGSGKSGGGAASNLKADYKSYLSNDRGKSPARDDADATAAMNKVTAMPY